MASAKVGGVNTPSETTRHFPYLCPQCGGPTHGSPTSSGQTSSFCEDCVSDRDIDDSDVLPA